MAVEVIAGPYRPRFAPTEPCGVDHAIAAGELDWPHRDPFDRMLVAQARLQRMLLATRDQAITDHLGAGALAA